MPNITITVDDRLYRAARIYAAQYETTLTEIMREFLTDIIPSNCYLGDMNYETFTGLERDRRRNAAREPRLERGYPLPPLSHWDSMENYTLESINSLLTPSNRIK